MIEGRLAEEIKRGLESDAKAPGPPETFRYRVDKRIFRVRFDRETVTERYVDVVIERKELR